jgi:hypothetical protein
LEEVPVDNTRDVAAESSWLSTFGVGFDMVSTGLGLPVPVLAAEVKVGDLIALL